MKSKIILICIVLSFVLSGCTYEKDAISDTNIDFGALEKEMHDIEDSFKREISNLKSDIEDKDNEIELLKSEVDSIKQGNSKVSEVENYDGIDETEKVIIKFMNAIENNDLSTLEKLTLPDRSIDMTALVYYKKYFRNDFPAFYTKYNKSTNSSYYKYTMYADKNDKYKDISFIWNKDDNKIYTDDIILNYSTWAEESMMQFIGYLKENDIDRLSRIIYKWDEEKNPYYDATKKLINKYKENFDLDSIKYEFTGNTTNINGSGLFIYRIYGSKDGKSVEHFIEAGFSWPSIYFKDEWIED